MPIVFYPTSFRKTQAFQAGLLHLVQLHRIPAGLTVYPHTLQIYNLGARDVLAKADPGVTAKLVSWRYFAGGDNETTTVAGDVDASSTPQVTSLSYGASAWTALKAAEALENLPDFSGPAASYEPRLLRIPGLLTEAFWLKSLSQSAGREADWVVPYRTPIKDLDQAKPYPIKDFLQMLYPLAQQAVKGNDSPIATRPSSPVERRTSK